MMFYRSLAIFLTIFFTTCLKWGFHELTNPADERHKTDDLWNFEKIFGRCNRFAKSAD